MRSPAPQEWSFDFRTRADSLVLQRLSIILLLSFPAVVIPTAPGCVTAGHKMSPETNSPPGAGPTPSGLSARLSRSGSVLAEIGEQGVIRGQDPLSGMGAVEEVGQFDGAYSAIALPPLLQPNSVTAARLSCELLPTPSASLVQPIRGLLPGPPYFSSTPAEASPATQPSLPAQAGGWSRCGLESIARKGLANRVEATPSATCRDTTTNAPAGSNTGIRDNGQPRSRGSDGDSRADSSTNSQPSSRDSDAGSRAGGATNSDSTISNSIARNRLERAVGAGEEPEYNYPDIHADPARLYHERFDVEEEHDRFFFPWLMNLIFEDRWILAEDDPKKAIQNQLRRRMKVDIRDPDPDTANFPNGAYTLPKGRAYIETSPVSFYGPSKISPRQYNWEYLFRYGLTDNLEFRIFSNGLTATRGKGGTTGVSPLAFDFKANFWEENTRYWIPAMGLEVYLQTTLGSPAFNSGTQPSTALLFDHTLPFGFNYEHNFGITGTQGPHHLLNEYEFSYQWSLQHQIVEDFDVFFHGFYNAAALPRVRNFALHELAATLTRKPTAVVTGVGAIWTVNNHLAIFGSYNFGLTVDSPRNLAFMGFAVAY